MAVKSLVKKARLLFFQRLQFSEKSCKGLRIVTRLVKVLHTELVGFGLKAAGELHEGDRQGQAGSALDGVTDAATHEDQGNGGNVRQVAASLLAGDMAGSYMGNLVGHDAGQLSFVIGRQDQAGIDVEKSAWQGESIDLVRINHLDREGYFGIGVAYQVLAHAVDVLANNRIFDQLDRGLHLLGVLAPHINLRVNAVPVA